MFYLYIYLVSLMINYWHILRRLSGQGQTPSHKRPNFVKHTIIFEMLPLLFLTYHVMFNLGMASTSNMARNENSELRLTNMLGRGRGFGSTGHPDTDSMNARRLPRNLEFECQMLGWIWNDGLNLLIVFEYTFWESSRLFVYFSSFLKNNYIYFAFQGIYCKCF